MKDKMKIAFFGSSLVSAYWNGAATYYRGILRALHNLDNKITFFEPDAYDRQKHRDLKEDPEYAEVVIYQPDEEDAKSMLKKAELYDVIVKASGVGVLDEFLEREVLKLKTDQRKVIFWDVDAPATLDRVEKNPEDPFLALIPQYDFIFTYGGGNPVIKAYKNLGAQACHPIYNALDRSTHFPVQPEERFKADLVFLGNRLPDREKRVEDFFLSVAEKMSDKKFLLGGSGWEDKPKTSNIEYLGHVYTSDHNALNSSPLAVLNISRESMARYGFSPATRVFEAAGSGACIITDKWPGIETFFEPGKEILVAESADDVIGHLSSLTPGESAKIGEAAYKKVISRHTYTHRAEQVVNILSGSKIAVKETV